MDLIKRLNKQVNEAQEDANNPFTILDIKKIRGVNDILEAGEGKCGEGKCGGKSKAENEEEGFSKQQMADMKKLVSQYATNDEVTPENVLDLAADDLEMLEYDPEEVEAMAPEIETMFKGKKK